MTNHSRFDFDPAQPFTARAHTEGSASLQQEYEGWQTLFGAQPPAVQHFLEAQARQLAESITQPEQVSQLRFVLPDQVLVDASMPGAPSCIAIPADQREQLAGGVFSPLSGSDIDKALRRRFAELEQSADRALATGASLLRHATAMYMVHSLLPSGRSVTYMAVSGEEIPNVPLRAPSEMESALTAATDAIVEESSPEIQRGELLAPFTTAARRFYLPQWVAFDDERLLLNSVAEAHAHIAAMQRFLEVLHAAVSLAPYMVADEVYQQKRYGMLGQLVNQGRALARYQTGEIIQTIQQRAHAHDLNRGLSLSLPYFDDQQLQIKLHHFEVIPAGRIMFVPAFVVRATRVEQAKVAQDTRLNSSTRRHLLAELEQLERAFDAASNS